MKILPYTFRRVSLSFGYVSKASLGEGSTFNVRRSTFGVREPHTKPLSMSGGGKCASGALNELWSFGEEAYAILDRNKRMKVLVVVGIALSGAWKLCPSMLTKY